MLRNIQLNQGVHDHHTWKLTRSGTYSSKSAYNAYFVGSIKFAPWRCIWKSWAPLQCKLFLWLAVLNRCWTGDRLAKRGLPHPAACPLCDQAEESINHILTSCAFAREFWFTLLLKLGLQGLASQGVVTFSSWWCKALKGVDKKWRKGLNSLIILSAWELWKHRNDCVFNNTNPSVHTAIRHVIDEGTLWCAAGANELAALVLELG
uniref:Reverse transcriptase zinc-binding domain-containing protein n=1 Tax=Arundo donax TaxID=35708 RepID=A0A0A9CIF0_ARUDO